MSRSSFRLHSPYEPCGDQPAAIEGLLRGLEEGRAAQVLLGVTGSGKTFTMANVIARLGMPTLVISHNKTLAAQLYAEFREYFPENAVHYFVSYYDYYQPEAYIPQRDIYIEKDADINQDIDRLRLAATSALLSRRDVILVASVSCIYGLGSPEDYARMILFLRVGAPADRREVLTKLVDMQYERTNLAVTRGHFRLRGDALEVFPSYEERVLRVEWDGDNVAELTSLHPVTRVVQQRMPDAALYPAKHFVLPEEKILGALDSIRMELDERLRELRGRGNLLEAQRLEARTRYDLEILEEIGYCKGIENYSRHLAGRAAGERPATLLDYFPRPFLTIVDESHATVPQIRGMYRGDQSRKETLVEHGFRLPSAMDNRPMRFEEWESTVGDVIYVSATPAPYELEKAAGRIVEQLIRPTGLVDPGITVRRTLGQIPDLLEEIRARTARKERVLVTTLTKRLAEQLSNYLQKQGVKGRYLHSEVDTLERVKVLRDLREGAFDVLVGVNLLREGLDLPEVSLVAILDADKEGFLRSETALIQTVGRTARNVNGQVILYADEETPSMRRAMDETNRRRKLQLAFNEKHGITPRTVASNIRRGVEEEIRARHVEREATGLDGARYEIGELSRELEAEMYRAADHLDFERAAELRDNLQRLRGEEAAPADRPRPRRGGKGPGRRGKGGR